MAYDDPDVVVAQQIAESRRQAAAIKPGMQSFDVIVVGSGASGGMAAFPLATAGLKVLVLEAGRLIDPDREYRAMEWPGRTSSIAGRCSSRRRRQKWDAT